jgi:hypothetical protein
MRKHWSEGLECQCGKRFRSMSAEAYHHHNFPVLCRRPKPPRRPPVRRKAHAAYGSRNYPL